MKPDLVVDIGNSRIKWGRCLDGRVTATISLQSEDAHVWDLQVKAWNITGKSAWAVAGVHPQRMEAFLNWLRDRGEEVTCLSSWQQLPLEVKVEYPDRVGMDRLLNAVAAKKSRVAREVSVFIIDAGSAVTVDWVDETGAFRGGAIFPGIRSMAQAVHSHTALLPLVDGPTWPNPILPGTSTKAAIEAGIFWAVAGGIKALVRQLRGRAQATRHAVVFLTGGDGPLLAPVLDPQTQWWSEMTLEGIRLAAESLP